MLRSLCLGSTFGYFFLEVQTLLFKGIQIALDLFLSSLFLGSCFVYLLYETTSLLF